MNSVLTFLSKNWQRFGLQLYGSPAELTSVVITPRFHASSHVVFLILRGDEQQPILVAKVPRLAGEGETLVREAGNLRAIQASREDGFASIPRVIAFERCWERPVLVETAIAGRPLEPPTVRADPAAACQTMVQWLLEVQVAGRTPARVHDNWFERLIAEPLSLLEKNMALTGEERALLADTWQLAERLTTLDFPLVVEHGDLSHPNLILRDGNGSRPEAGVVDWELAHVHGLPGCDLFFFLAYVAFAQHGARENRRYVEAFHNTFFDSASWILPYVREYTQEVGLPTQALTPLFVLTWARYLLGLLERLDRSAFAGGEMDKETIAWLRGNRYYALWRHTMEHLEEVNLAMLGGK